MKRAYLFPGQGSQFVGMGKELAASHFEKASQILGRDLKKIAFEGPEEELKETSNTQPALYVAGFAVFEASKSWGILPDALAGHSLGEYTALAAAGVFSFEDGLRLVQARAKAMSEAAQKRPGAMAAVLGMEDAQVEMICSEIREGVVQCANFNSPGQVVISGEKAAVEAASLRLKDAGALKVVPLAVSGAFHSPLMQEAGEALRAAFGAVQWKNPEIPVIANVDAAYYRSSAQIQESLVAQVSSPVRWTQCMRRLLQDGIGQFAEMGAGKVLQGLMKKIDKAAACTSIADQESFEKGGLWLKS
jgi:[acyl-carrier-protein] S-malonyltransferase